MKRLDIEKLDQLPGKRLEENGQFSFQCHSELPQAVKLARHIRKKAVENVRGKHGRVYPCPLCEDFPLHGMVFEDDCLKQMEKIAVIA